MGELKCAKCGAEISEEQLTCSACGFVNDIEVCKKLAGQEDIALQEKAEKKCLEKLNVLYAHIKKSSLPFTLISVLGVLLVVFALLGVVFEMVSLTNRTTGFPESLANAYIASGLRLIWSSQGIAIIFITGILLDTISKNVCNLLRTNSLSKKIKEIDFDGTEWLTAVQKDISAQGFTLEKTLRKLKRNYWIANAVCDANNPQLGIGKNRKNGALATLIIAPIQNVGVGFLSFDLMLFLLFGAKFTTMGIVGIVVTIVMFILNVSIAGVIDGKATKAVSEELKKFDVQPEQPTQPEQNA